MQGRTEANMDALFVLRTLLDHPDQPTVAALPPGRVRTLGEPKVGECLVIVSEGGVVQTGPVRSFRITEDCIELETDRSRYTLGRSVKQVA